MIGIGSLFTPSIVLLFVAIGESARSTVHTTKDSFDMKTYGGDLIGLRHDAIISRKSYYEYVSDNVACVGKWCSGRKSWRCGRGDGRDCYRPTFIIDQDESLIPPSIEDGGSGCESVPGNMIMAHGRWIGEIRLRAMVSYDLAIGEKRIAFGQTLFDRAVRSIQSCVERLNGTSSHRREDALVYDSEGVWVVPEDANITCLGCESDSVCDECSCDRCTFFEYATLSDPMLMPGTILLVIGALALFLFFVLIGGMYIRRTDGLRIFRLMRSEGESPQRG